MTSFFVYVDWTTEEISRPFYVGKGNLGRVRQRKRNVYHSRVAQKYGHHREVVLMTSVEDLTLDVEIQYIAELKTQYGIPGHWGTNLTAGGEGLSNPPPEIRKKMSESHKRHPPDTPETRRRKSESAKRLNSDLTVRARKSKFMKGRIRSPEYRANIAKAKQKPVQQLDQNGNVVATYASGLLAEQATGISRSKICLCCKRQRPKAGGFAWRYKI